MTTSKKEMETQAAQQMEKDQENLLQTLKVQGTVVSARYGTTRFDESANKYRVAINSDSIPYDDIHAYDNSGSKLTPSWLKERTGYINLASIYSIPIMDTKGKKIDFEDWLENYNVIGSTVIVKIKQKDGAIYPEAIKVLEDGEERDPFADM